MPPSIDLQNLVIRYGKFVAVDQLSFQVNTGEIFGLLGPNGAGKTTTFLCLTRQVPIHSGSIQLLGLNLQTQFDAIKPRFGYVPDTDNHFDEFTAFQNLKLFADLYQVIHDRIDHCLELVELTRAKYLPVRTFSKGMKKKLLIARELLHEPELLLLDEPTANLDVHSTELIRKLILDLAKRGTTILITTHNMGEVEQICDRVAIINHGRLINLDTPTAFKVRHTERIVDVVLERGYTHERLAVKLDDEEARQDLARILNSEVPVTLHTREFNFYQAFLKLTGEEYN